MSDELKKDEELLQTAKDVSQPEQEIVSEASVEEEKVQPVQEEEKEEQVAHQSEIKEEQNNPETEQAEAPTVEEKEVTEPVEEKPEEEVKEEPKEEEPEVPEEQNTPQEEPEVVKEEVDIEAIKAELEELKAEKQEQADIEVLGKENARVANEFNQLCQGLGKGLEEAFEKYAIPTDKTIDELEKEDPAKAQLAKNLTKQANDIIEAARKDAEAFLNEKAHEVVFKKADRLLQKMDVSEEEAPIVAETFLDIIAQSGVKDLHDDLKAKLELAVAKAKMDVKKAGKAAEVVKEAAGAVKEHTERVIEKIEKVEDVIKPKEEKEAVEPELEIKTVASQPVEEINKSEFEEGIGNNPQPVSGLSIDNVVEKMLELPFKEQTKFYKEHYALIEEAMKHRAR